MLEMLCLFRASNMLSFVQYSTADNHCPGELEV